ncbi:MAG: hypothetical protein IGR76_19235 [Synechococcales cyanobacterium T60_A2020_003]|nr:hypothetical protein [Synechococcales cyanobacterium T60_A2020_003]
MTLAAGTPLQQQRYVIRTALAQDATSVKYLADHTYLDQLFCLETLSEQVRHDPAFDAISQAFLHSARQVASCRHPHLANVVDVFFEDGLPYVGFEYPQGISLQDLLQIGEPLPSPLALSYVQQVGAALQGLHACGMGHGNIRPATIIRCHGPDGVKLTGIRLPLTHSSNPSERDSSLPDRFVQDVRSLAAVLWTMLTTEPVTPDLADRDILAYRLRQAGIAVAPELVEAIAWGLATQPTHQWVLKDWLGLLPGESKVTMPAFPKQAIAPSRQHGSQPHLSSSTPTVMQTSELDPSSFQSQATMPASTGERTQLEPITALQVQTSLQSEALASRPVHRKRSSRRLPVMLGITALIAGFAGAGAGAALRFSEPTDSSTGSTSALFNRAQSFPPSDHWPGQSESELDTTSGYLFEHPNSGWMAPTRSDYSPSAPQASTLLYPDPYLDDGISDESAADSADLNPLGETDLPLTESVPDNSGVAPDPNVLPNLPNPSASQTNSFGASSPPPAPALPEAAPSPVPEAALPTAPPPTPIKQDDAETP